MRKWLIAGAAAAIAALVGVCAYAQVIGLNLDLDGKVTWVVSYGPEGPGGSGVYVTSDQIRNAISHTLIPTGTTVTTSPVNLNGLVIATGAITTWTVNLPNPAFKSEHITIANGTGSNFTSNVTVTALTTPQNQTLAQSFASQSISAGSSVEFQYDYNSLTWYRIR